jgi:hypothetical protein
MIAYLVKVQPQTQTPNIVLSVPNTIEIISNKTSYAIVYTCEHSLRYMSRSAEILNKILYKLHVCRHTYFIHTRDYGYIQIEHIHCFTRSVGRGENNSKMWYFRLSRL